MKNKINIKGAIALALTGMILTGCGDKESESVQEATTVITEETTIGTEAQTTEATFAETEETALGVSTSEEDDAAVVWYSIDNGELIRNTDSSYSTAFPDLIFDKLIEAGVLTDGMYLLDYSGEVMYDEIVEIGDGVGIVSHTALTLDVSLPFIDILNQEDEETQLLILEAISKSFKESFDAEIVWIRCDGEPIITDLIDYESIVSEEAAAIEKYEIEDTEDVEPVTAIIE